jgi:hypothetical protein
VGAVEKPKAIATGYGFAVTPVNAGAGQFVMFCTIQLFLI